MFFIKQPVQQFQSESTNRNVVQNLQQDRRRHAILQGVL